MHLKERNLLARALKAAIEAKNSQRVEALVLSREAGEKVCHFHAECSSNSPEKLD